MFCNIWQKYGSFSPPCILVSFAGFLDLFVKKNIALCYITKKKSRCKINNNEFRSLELQSSFAYHGSVLPDSWTCSGSQWCDATLSSSASAGLHSVRKAAKKSFNKNYFFLVVLRPPPMKTKSCLLCWTFSNIRPDSRIYGLIYEYSTGYPALEIWHWILDIKCVQACSTSGCPCTCRSLTQTSTSSSSWAGSSRFRPTFSPSFCSIGKEQIWSIYYAI